MFPLARPLPRLLFACARQSRLLALVFPLARPLPRLLFACARQSRLLALVFARTRRRRFAFAEGLGRRRFPFEPLTLALSLCPPLAFLPVAGASSRRFAFQHFTRAGRRYLALPHFLFARARCLRLLSFLFCFLLFIQRLVHFLF